MCNLGMGYAKISPRPTPIHDRITPGFIAHPVMTLKFVQKDLDCETFSVGVAVKQGGMINLASREPSLFVKHFA